jgi:hypothetical protein
MGLPPLHSSSVAGGRAATMISARRADHGVPRFVTGDERVEDGRAGRLSLGFRKSYGPKARALLTH